MIECLYLYKTRSSAVSLVIFLLFGGKLWERLSFIHSERLITVDGAGSIPRIPTNIDNSFNSGHTQRMNDDDIILPYKGQTFEAGGFYCPYIPLQTTGPKIYAKLVPVRMYESRLLGWWVIEFCYTNEREHRVELFNWISENSTEAFFMTDKNDTLIWPFEGEDYMPSEATFVEFKSHVDALVCFITQS